MTTEAIKTSNDNERETHLAFLFRAFAHLLSVGHNSSSGHFLRSPEGSPGIGVDSWLQTGAVPSTPRTAGRRMSGLGPARACWARPFLKEDTKQDH